ncbi:FAD:protein FMN transferase [Amnibacterium flavum]|uniref:FAD:protein FMN transferase n=1 Tax=Amnibacterium flavum TaxID=2173173 RepID=A0A2V1HMR9_9MICO|nr:FAD:protein FMN transferase [Amnibacterium flavum]PVZ93913.1 FAD:protein FMN transferase [Amnibacterium flavum]
MPAADRRHHTLRFDAIGTAWQIDSDVLLAPHQTREVHDLVERFDLAYSRFRADSLVTRLAEHGGSVTFPADLPPLVEVYDALFDATDGAMTPLVGLSLERLGYDAGYSLTPSGDPIASLDWRSGVAVDGSTVTATAPVLIDFGAAGKGYLVDLVAGLLARLGLPRVTIDASGDLLHRAEGPLRVALEHPYDPSTAIGVLEIGGGAICGSATNRRAWGSGLHHVLDGLTGLPVDEVAATWAVADDALHADALATALFFADADTLAGRTGWRFEAVRMFTDGRVETTPGLPGEVFTR